MHSYLTKVALLVQVLCFSPVTFAEKINYEIRGTHQYKSAKPTNFTLRWTEESTVIEGFYREGEELKLPMKGKLNEVKRTFIISGIEERDYKVLFIETTPIKGAQTATIPLTVNFMDEKYKTLFTQNMRVIYHGEP